MSATRKSAETINKLRTVPGSWLQIICNSRDPGGDMAWSVTVKLGSDNAQYVYKDLDGALAAVAQFFKTHGIDVDAPTPPRKLKLKRSTS